jgi:5-methyltetrahydrofolate--homocysteine methyltransferase
MHVLDASRAVGVVSALIDAGSGGSRADLEAKNRADQEQLRRLHANKQAKPLVPYAEANAKAPKIAWTEADVAKPAFLGRRVLEKVPLKSLVPYVDWTFFFTAWELVGKFPAILDDPRQGEAARDLFATAQKVLEDLVANERVTASGVYGFWPAASEGNDVVLYTDEERARELVRFPMLRQQQHATHACLADFVAPVSSGFADHVGAFAVTAGIGADELAAAHKGKNDDYTAIIVKALADRLAEAFAEMLHERARREAGYGEAKKLTNEELIAEKYRGIRPAFGYPACPDHTAKRALFDLLDARAAGITLTDSCAMYPAASVSGLYIGHPAARYFNVGRIGRDQLEDYARRKGTSVEDMERWLSPNL